jgi:hypothetical protein
MIIYLHSENFAVLVGKVLKDNYKKLGHTGFAPSQSCDPFLNTDPEGSFLSLRFVGSNFSVGMNL